MGMNGRFNEQIPISEEVAQQIARIRAANPDKSISEIKDQIDAARAEKERRRATNPDKSISESKEEIDAIKNSIKTQYYKLGGDSIYGALGIPIGDIIRERSGVYSQEYEYGKILTGKIEVPPVQHFYTCDIFLAGIKCFGTDDPGNPLAEAEDEPYVIITTLSTASAFLDGEEEKISKTVKTKTFTEISKGEVFGQNGLFIGDVPFGPYGIMLKIMLLDQEYGDPESIRKEVEITAKKAAEDVKDLASALAGVSIDKILPKQVLDNEILDILGDLSLNVISKTFGDDKIDEKTWLIDGSMLREWVDKGLTETSGIDHPELTNSNVNTNFPRDNGPSYLFSGGGGSYKIYLRVIPKIHIIDFGSKPNN
ncbi:hypothetical protein QCI42_27935 [Bacillus fungorum]|uniref:hypothetical protein n=1 Tax=Bacillus fungorum TaxID=2039284 RepID=UPI00339245E0